MRPRSDTILVWTGAPCSYGCSACPIDPSSAEAGLSPASLQNGLAALPGRDARLVVLVGGEPFLRPDLLRLVATIRAAGCAAGIVTTGRPLIYPQVRDKLRRIGLAYLRAQLFGFGEAHDRATGVPGSFEQAMAGLKAWIAESNGTCDVDVAINIRRRPTDTLVSEVEGIARALATPDVQLVVATKDAQPYDEDSIRQAQCTFAGWNDEPSRPLLAWEDARESPVSASHLTVPPLWPAFATGAPRACCLGMVAQMATTSVPLETKANSFNFVRTGVSVPWTADPNDCTAYWGSGVGGRGSGERDLERNLWLIENDRLVLYSTDTGDFTAAEIAQIKVERSHLFVDRSPAGVLDDFREGMRRVVPDSTCDRCPHRPRCSRRFAVVEGQPFAREEAWISDYVARLHGRVLDVGCGEQLYRDQLAPLVRGGRVHYTGLDPDVVSLGPLREALPQGRFFVGGIEDFCGEPASYDRILCLRSLNHVFSLDEALGRMSQLLEPGGQLLIVETTPFAMLRRPEQVAAADQAPRAGHQHFRNVTSYDVLPFARRHALRVLEHRPAQRDSTNEWILLLERVRASAE